MMQGVAIYSLSSSATKTAALSLSSSSSLRSTTFLHHHHHHRPLRRLSLLRSSPTSLSLSSTFTAHSLSSKPLLSLKPPNATPSSSSNGSNSLSESPTVNGAKLVPLFFSVAVGLILRFAIPKPAELTIEAWKLLAIFLSTITGLILSPLPVGAWAFLGVTASIVTRTLPFETAFCAFTYEVIWLIIISFFFARGFVKTGLGDRIATC